jgi:hypothetical protein
MPKQVYQDLTCDGWWWSHKRHDLREKFIEQKTCFWFSVRGLSEMFIILSRSQRDTVTNVHRPSTEGIFTFVRVMWNLHFLGRLSKNILKYKISWKSLQWEQCQRTDRLRRSLLSLFAILRTCAERLITLSSPFDDWCLLYVRPL